MISKKRKKTEFFQILQYIPIVTAVMLPQLKTDTQSHWFRYQCRKVTDGNTHPVTQRTTVSLGTSPLTNYFMSGLSRVCKHYIPRWSNTGVWSTYFITCQMFNLLGYEVPLRSKILKVLFRWRLFFLLNLRDNKHDPPGITLWILKFSGTIYIAEDYRTYILHMQTKNVGNLFYNSLPVVRE